MPTSKPFKCPTCGLQFSRSEHLHRHVGLHTGEKLYQCPCGEGFFRSDVLVQHLRKCDKGRESQDKFSKAVPQKKTRTKRACDKCAQMKSKCDGRTPCSRCSRQSLECIYTRAGRFDPYSAYSILRDEKSSTEPEDQKTSLSEPHQLSPDVIQKVSASPSSRGISDGQSSNSSSALIQQQKPDIRSPSGSREIQRRQSQSDHGLGVSSDLDTAYMDLDDPLTSSSEWAQHFSIDAPLEPFFPLSSMLPDELLQTLESPFYSPFSLEQIDPVEAKCTEIKNLLTGAEAILAGDIIASYITRENVLYLLKLYGTDLRPHCPIIHAPTFNLMRTSPLLLVAIMLVGACHAKKVIPPDHITKLAMQVLKVIENQPHEILMSAPPLSTVQSSIVVCSLLFRSRRELASEFVTSYFSRNLSLIKRTGVFEPVELVDYTYVTEEAFDWEDWVHQESLRRSLCQVFCQDIAGCIFQGSSPCISPLELDIQMPCYESAWEAKTAAACLQQLQNMPQQIRVSSAIRRLMKFPATDGPLFEASGLGMLVLMTGIHFLLFEATKYDLMFSFDAAYEPNTKQPPTNSPRFSSLDLGLQQELLAPSIASLADKAVTSTNFSAMKQVNNALNAWRSTWDMRLYREAWCETLTAVTFALPFWWLAKLYIFLHYYAPLIGADSEFAISRVQRNGARNKMKVQGNILRWLSKFSNHNNTFEGELYDAHQTQGSEKPK